MLDQFLFWIALLTRMSGLAFEIAPTPQATIVEIIRGGGREVFVGDVVTLHVIASTLDGRELANSERRGLPLRIKMGDSSTPSYLEFAVRGMAVGGSREVVLPPDMAFGKQGALPFVAPDTTIMLRVRVLQVLPPPPAR